MADKYLTLQTTPAGMNMIIRSLYGDKITFTRIVIGNGTPESLENVTELTSPILSVGITKADAKADYLLLTGNVNSSDVPAGFYGYELGVYAKGADEVEHLYAYRYTSTDVDFFPSADSGRTLELTMSIVVQLGNAQNVTAILVEGEAYARIDHKHNAADITEGVLPISQGGTGSANGYSSDLLAVRPPVKIPASAWSYSVPYTAEVNVSGITANIAPIISCGMPATVTAEEVKAMKKAYSMIDRAVTGAGKITFYCYNDRPTKDIYVLVKGV